MNNRKDKVELLKAIARGEVKPEDIPKNPTVISERKDWFLGLMMLSSVSPEERGESHIIFVGEAKQSMDKAFEEIKERNGVIKSIK